MKLRVGIIGLGKMGVLHEAQLKSNKDVEIAAAADVDKRLAPYIKRLNPDIPFYGDVKTMMDSVPLDAVFICTPAFTHPEVSELCAQYHVHQFIEKPLAESLASSKRILNLENFPDTIFMIGYSFAFHPVFQKVKELLDKKILGKIYRFFTSTYISIVLQKTSGWLFEKNKSGGGIIINSASHLIHLLWWYFGDIKHIYSKAQSIYSNVEDFAYVFFEFKNGIQSIMDASWSIPGYRLQEIIIVIEGQNGKMEVSNDMLKIDLKTPSSGFNKGWTTLHKTDLGDSADFFLGSEEFNIEDKHFVDCCLNKKKPLISAKEAYEVQRIIEGIYRSAENNRVIDMDKEL